VQAEIANVRQALEAHDLKRTMFCVQKIMHR